LRGATLTDVCVTQTPIGGATLLIELRGLRFLAAPRFDGPGLFFEFPLSAFDVLHQVVLHLGLVDDNELAPTSRERRLDRLRTQSRQPVAVLHDDRLHRGIGYDA